jgi:hypothetical protein
MGHRNARLTVHGRLLLVQRVRDEGMPIAHVARAMIDRSLATCSSPTTACPRPLGPELGIPPRTITRSPPRGQALADARVRRNP